MTTSDKSSQLDHLLEHNIESVYPSSDFAKELLLQKESISIYLGVDPSAPDIHLGNAVILRKLREFQQLGHKVIFLIGDFTGMIGDPTDKTAARTQLTPKQVKENARTYQEQVSLILNFKGNNPAEIRFNSQWLGEMDFAEIIKLASNFTVQQMIERDMFQERLERNRPIYLHEFLYPLMQGYDSVAMGVDAEIGGTDQTFNMLAGRDLMKSLRNKEKIVFTCPLLPGTDGQKMSKSIGNVINVFDEPKEMYGKLMSIRDDLITTYLEMTTDFHREEINNFRSQLEEGENPMEIKKVLAYTVTKFYHGEESAQQAEKYFERVVQEGKTPSDLRVVRAGSPGKVDLVDALLYTETVTSKSQAKRLIDQGGVEVDGVKITDLSKTVDPHKEPVIKIGKREYFQLKPPS